MHHWLNILPARNSFQVLAIQIHQQQKKIFQNCSSKHTYYYYRIVFLWCYVTSCRDENVSYRSFLETLTKQWRQKGIAAILNGYKSCWFHGYYTASACMASKVYGVMGPLISIMYRDQWVDRTATVRTDEWSRYRNATKTSLYSETNTYPKPAIYNIVVIYRSCITSME